MNVGTLTVTLGIDATQLRTATTHMNTLAQRMRTIGYLTSAVITMPIVAAGKAAITTASEYEFAIQKIVGLTGTAQKEVNQWSQEIQKTSKEFGKQPLELAEAMYFIASSGIKGSEALQTLRMSAMAAASGLGETQQVADVVTSALNAYRGTGIGAVQITDQLTAAVREGKSEASGFASAVGQVIPIASQMGVSFDQVVGGMAAITLTGSKAATSAVYLKGIFNALLKEADQGIPILKKMGWSWEYLRAVLREEGLISLMEKFRQVQQKLGDTAVHELIPDIRGLSGEMSLAGKNFEYNKELLDRVRNSAGSTAKSWEAVGNTLKKIGDRLKATVSSALIDFGQTVGREIIPFAEKLVEKLKAITEHFNSLTEAQKQHRLAMVAWTAAAGPILLISSTLLYTISGLTTIFRGFLKVLQWCIPAIGVIETRLTALLRLTRTGIMSGTGVGLARGAVAITGWIGAFVGAVTIGIVELVKYQKKVKETAREQTSFNQALVTANNEIKKLKDLVNIDYKAMSVEELFALKSTAITEQAKITKNIKENLDRAGVTIEEFNKGKKVSDYVDIQVEAYNKWDEAIKNVDTALRAYLQTTVDTDKAKKIAALATAKEQAVEAAEALARLNEEWNKIEKDIFREKLKRETPTIPKFGVPSKAYTPGLMGVSKKLPGGGFMPDNFAYYFEQAEKQKEEAEKLEESLRGVKTLAAELTQVFSNMFMSIGEGWKSFTQSIVNGLKRIAAEIMARIVVFGILSIISGGAGGFAKIVKTFIKGGFADFVFKPLGRGMAKGGRVPGGYPNDSFPARLTSGEDVLPPGVLDNIVNQPSNMKIEVEKIKIEGKHLAILLRRAEAYN